jgi:hypothetical protein
MEPDGMPSDEFAAEGCVANVSPGSDQMIQDLLSRTWLNRSAAGNNCSPLIFFCPGPEDPASHITDPDVNRNLRCGNQSGLVGGQPGDSVGDVFRLGNTFGQQRFVHAP